MAQIRYSIEKRHSCGCCSDRVEETTDVESIVKDGLSGPIESSIQDIRSLLAVVVDKLADDGKISVGELSWMLDLDYKIKLLEILEEK